MRMPAPPDGGPIRARAADNADRVVILESREQTVREIRSEDVDVVMRQHDDFADAVCDGGVVSLGQRSWIADHDDFVRYMREHAPVKRIDPLLFRDVDRAC